jgi:hypothetical protein
VQAKNPTEQKKLDKIRQYFTWSPERQFEFRAAAIRLLKLKAKHPPTKEDVQQRLNTLKKKRVG